MYVCMYVCIYLCMYVCFYVCFYVCILTHYSCLASEEDRKSKIEIK